MTMPILNQSPVRFFADTHTYLLDNLVLQGITSTLIPLAFPDTYRNVPQHILDRAAAKGTVMHQTIELYDELGAESDLPELASYKRFLTDNALKVIATEYVVSDNLDFATCIDKVLVGSDDRVLLLDLKRTAEIHRREVRLQLSLGRLFFMMLNPHIPDPQIAVLRLRDEKCDFVRFEPLPDTYLYALMKAYLYDDLPPVHPDDNPFPSAVVSSSAEQSSAASSVSQPPFPAVHPSAEGYLPKSIADTEREVYDLELQLSELKARQAKLRSGLLELMERHNVKKWQGQFVSLTRTLPTVRRSFDSAAFKADHPDLYKSYLREKTTESSLRITLTSPACDPSSPDPF